MTRRDLIPPRDEIMRTMERIYRYRMTTTPAEPLGPRCRRLDLDHTRAGRQGELRRDDIVCVRRTDRSRAHKPSSEFPFHRAIYADSPDLRRIVHAHPWPWWPSASAGRSPTSDSSRRPGASAAGSGSRLCPPRSEALGRTSPTSSPKASTADPENHGVPPHRGRLAQGRSNGSRPSNSPARRSSRPSPPRTVRYLSRRTQNGRARP